MSEYNMSMSPADVPSSSEETTKPTGRRRGRQSSDIDPDVKRQRFLERNRAAASRLIYCVFMLKIVVVILGMRHPQRAGLFVHV